MAEKKIRRALIAVYDKTGIAEFARALVDEFGIEIISTGGTAKHLKDAGIPVTLVEEVTGFPEMLDGRVKTLHPNIHAAILADRDNPEHMRQLAEHGIQPIDMVVVNLYPFEKTVADPNCKFEDAIEMIDIGGPCMLRAAAKNHKHVMPVSSPDNYLMALNFLRNSKGNVPQNGYRGSAADAFWKTSVYDRRVSQFLETEPHFQTMLAPRLTLWLKQLRGTRYGENPHQQAGRYFIETDELPSPYVNHDKPENWSERTASFNNFVDSDAATSLCCELTRAYSKTLHPEESDSLKPDRYCAVFIKHTNACGVGVADNPVEAYRRAYLGDPKAAMGGILAVNFPVTPIFAESVMDSLDRWGRDAGAGAFFAEVWLAPYFEKGALEVIYSKKKWGKTVFLIGVGRMNIAPRSDELEYKAVAGAMLVQTRDLVGLNEEQWKVVTKRKPSESEMADLRLAWLVSKHTKSNAISICKDGMLIGNGAGQMSRVMSCRIATWLAKENGHAEKLPGSVGASDAFFPFRDGPEILLDAGVTAIIQPGGSKRDDETIAACDARGAAMIFTGTRHFKH